MGVCPGEYIKNMFQVYKHQIVWMLYVEVNNGMLN